MDTITVPKEFLLDLLRIYGNLPRPNDVSYNSNINSMRRLCEETGVTKEMTDYFVEIVSGKKQ
jgi:hypothetical protein